MAARALSNLVEPEDILLDIEADGKLSALNGVSDRLALRAGSNHGVVVEALLRRERLGSTVVGDGAAMPHGRLEGLAHPAAAVARLRRPVPFGTHDDDAVDLMLAVLWPEANVKGFVPSLARFWRILRHAEFTAGLRRARTNWEAHALIEAFEEVRP